MNTNLFEALQKLNLNDASLVFEPDNSEILGSGFRCGFLGTLHMEVVKERLEREYNLDLITTAPSVAYEILRTNGEESFISSPAELPTANEIDAIREPIIKSTSELSSDSIFSLITEAGENSKTTSSSIFFKSL